MAIGEELPDPSSFGELKTMLAQVISRGRDRTRDLNILGVFINAAEQYICTELGGNCEFLEHTETITIEGGTGEYTFAPQVRDIISLRDESYPQSLRWVDRQKWNAYIANPRSTTGTPYIWTRFGYVRRTNEESPDRPYGQLKIETWPVVTEDSELQADELLRPGHMVLDGDMPVIPISWHAGLLHVAAWHAASMDVGSKAFQEHERLAGIWLRSMKMESIRNMAGTQRFVTREEHERNRSTGTLIPPTRAAQLGW